MTSNPFTFGNPIRDPAKFFGRREELRQVVNRLRSSAHESTSIVGERRIGKTSLLKHLENSMVAQSLGLPPEQFCMVYMDFQGLTDITPPRFWQRVLQKLERAICKPELAVEIKEMRSRDTFDLFDLEDLFTMITDEQLTPVLLLDEFEYVTQNPNFGSDFFGGLRALAIHQNLPLITATRRELIDLCHSEELKGSPFFNIFANIVLRPFSPEDVKALLEGNLAGTGISFKPAESDLVLKLGGGYPFFTQMAAFFMFEAKAGGLEKEALLQQVCRQFDEQSDAHYAYMWGHTSESEKITLLADMALTRQKAGAKTLPTLANLAGMHQRAHLDVPELVKRGLLVENRSDGTYCLLSPSLERWIAHEILAPPGEEEEQNSVSDWLAAGGRDNLEPVKGFLPKFKKKYWPMLSGFAKDITLELISNLTIELMTRGMF